MTDIVSHIKKMHPPEDYDLDTAEGRWRWDQDLRAELLEVEPYGLRQHAAQMIKDWRWTIISGFYKGTEEQPLGREIKFEADLSQTGKPTLHISGADDDIEYY